MVLGIATICVVCPSFLWPRWKSDGRYVCPCDTSEELSHVHSDVTDAVLPLSVGAIVLLADSNEPILDPSRLFVKRVLKNRYIYQVSLKYRCCGAPQYSAS